MSVALKAPHRMTVAEFLDWDPEDGTGALWQLRDGESEMRAPTTENHGAIQGELHALIRNHLAACNSPCRSIINPGVTPRMRSEYNALIPDLAVTCAPPSKVRLMREPVVLAELMSVSNEAETRANLWAYATVPSVREIIVISSVKVAAEILRRQPDGLFLPQPEFLGPDGVLRMDSIGFSVPLRDVYRTAGLYSPDA